MALEGAQRCADLTHRLLAFSRRQPLQTATVDVKGLMPGLVEVIQGTLGERINIKLEADGPLFSVRADRAQLEAALLNLAVNARDAMPDGGDLLLRPHNRA